MEIYPTTLFVTIAILSILVLVLGYTTFNLLKKNERDRRYSIRIS